MKNFTRTFAVFIVVTGLCVNVQAHRAWIVPAVTVLSADEESWTTFDAAVSNDIFHTDHAPLRLDGVLAIAPDGSKLELQNTNTGKFRSTFDLHLQQKGTYKIVSASNGLNARWETDAGERQFWPPRGTVPTPEGFAKEVPKKAKNLQISQASRRIETFVTLGAPDRNLFKPTNVGLEMIPVTHPNDLFAGEKAEFSFLIDGKPAVGATVTLIPEGMRYRNDQAALEVTTDKKGKASITWPQAGKWWLSAKYSDEKAKKPATQRNGNYVATFEVFPE